MPDQAVVGTPSTTSINPGVATNLRSSNQGELVITPGHSRGYEAAYRNQRFIGANQAVFATATIAGLNTSITGTSVLYNPANSTVNLVLDRFGIGFVLAPATPLAYGLAVGASPTAPTGTFTSMASKSCLIGSGKVPSGQLVISAAITLPVTPTVAVVLGTLQEGAIATTYSSGTIVSYFDLNGNLVLQPGGFAVFWTSAILAASAHIASWEWEEVPV